MYNRIDYQRNSRLCNRIYNRNRNRSRKKKIQIIVIVFVIVKKKISGLVCLNAFSTTLQFITKMEAIPPSAHPRILL